MLAADGRLDLVAVFALVDRQTNADRVERFFPQFVVIARGGVGLARVPQHERLAVRQRPIAIATLAVAHLVEELVRGRRIVGDAAPVTRRVAGDTGWNGHL